MRVEKREFAWEFSQLSCPGQTRTRVAWELHESCLHVTACVAKTHQLSSKCVLAQSWWDFQLSYQVFSVIIWSNSYVENGDHFFCSFPLQTDIDECKDRRTCSTNADCSNSPGSYLCQCKQGYTGNGEICTGIWHEMVTDRYSEFYAWISRLNLLCGILI
jgi:hypothetical protein